MLSDGEEVLPVNSQEEIREKEADFINAHEFLKNTQAVRVVHGVCSNVRGGCVELRGGCVELHYIWNHPGYCTVVDWFCTL